MVQILDPTDEREPVHRELSQRPSHLSRVALLDINKVRGNVLIDQLQSKLSERMPGVTFTRYKKPTFARPAPPELLKQILAETDFVIEALAD
jgi:hypothetical protein